MVEPAVGQRRDVPLDQEIVIKFPADVDPLTINSSTVQLEQYVGQTPTATELQALLNDDTLLNSGSQQVGIATWAALAGATVGVVYVGNLIEMHMRLPKGQNLPSKAVLGILMKGVYDKFGNPISGVNPDRVGYRFITTGEDAINGVMIEPYPGEMVAPSNNIRVVFRFPYKIDASSITESSIIVRELGTGKSREVSHVGIGDKLVELVGTINILPDDEQIELKASVSRYAPDSATLMTSLGRTRVIKHAKGDSLVIYESTRSGVGYRGNLGVTGGLGPNLELYVMDSYCNAGADRPNDQNPPYIDPAGVTKPRPPRYFKALILTYSRYLC